jgi:hypothetical protein
MISRTSLQIDVDHRQVGFGRVLERGRHLLLRLGHRQPGLDSRQMRAFGALVGWRALAVRDSTPGRHQVYRAGLDPLFRPDAIPVHDRARKQEGDGRQVDVRMRADIDALAG